MRRAPITQQSVSINANVQETGGPQGEAQNLSNVANILEQKRDKVQEQAIDNAYIRGQKVITEELEKLSQQYPTDPDGLSNAIAEYSEGFLGDIDDDEMSARFDLQLTTAGTTAVNRARANRTRVINDQTVFEVLQGIETIKPDLRNISRGLLSADPDVRASSAVQFQEALSRIEFMASVTDQNGLPLFTANQRFSALSDMKDMALEGAVTEWISQQPDKTQALEAWQNGEIVLDLPDGEGGFESFNVRDTVSPRIGNLIETEAKRQIAEAKSAESRQRALNSSTYSLMIEQADNDFGPDPFAGRGKIDKLTEIAQQVENDPLLNNSPEGLIKKNSILEKLDRSSESVVEEQALVFQGANFHAGNQAYNPKNSDHKKAVELYYKATMNGPVLGNATPAERNGFIIELTNNLGSVIEPIKGELAVKAKSNDPAVIAEVTDLIDRQNRLNPALTSQYLTSEDMVRIDMVNNRRNAGLSDEDAFKEVKEILDPRNRPSQENIKMELSEIKKNIDFRQQTSEAFRSWGDWFGGFVGGGIDDSNPVERSAMDFASYAYENAFERTYARTRDEDAAHKAARQEMALYGRTSVNPSPIVMKHRPEDYYQIENQDPSWIREQAINDIMKMQSGGFNPISKNDLKKNLYIVTDIENEAAARAGQPTYKLVYMEDGEPRNLLLPTETWQPDIQRQRDELVGLISDQDRVEKIVRSQFGSGSLAVGLLSDRALFARQRRADKVKEIDKQLRELGVDLDASD